MADAVHKLNPFTAAATPKARANRLVAEKESSALSLDKARAVVRFVFRLIVLCASLALLWFAGQWVWGYVKISPAFAVSDVQVTGLERLERSDVMRAAGLSLGDNIFDKDLEELETHIKSHPWIAEATVRRHLPDTYFFEIREHRPAAVLSLETLYLVAADGSVFKQLAPSDPVDFPVITGVDKQRFKAERDYRASLLLGVLALLEDYREAGLWRREPLSEVHVHDKEALSMYIGNDVMLVRLGHGPYRKKIHRLRKILDKLDQKRVRAAYILLNNHRRTERAVVRLRD